MRRLCLVADVEGYSGRGNQEAIEVQNRVWWALWHAFKVAGVDPRKCQDQDRGDGRLVLLPPGVDEVRVVPRLLLALRAALARVNERPGGAGRIRLRVALAQGVVHEAALGFVGNAVIDACRLLDSAELRKVLGGRPDADVAVVVTEDLYRDLIAHGYGGIDPGAFRRAEVSIPEKGFSAAAYLYAPGPGVDTSLVPRFTGVEGISSPLLTVTPWVALGLTAGGAVFALSESAVDLHDEVGDSLVGGVSEAGFTWLDENDEHPEISDISGEAEDSDEEDWR